MNRSAQELKAEDAVVFTVQTSKADEDKLNDWVKKNNIHFPVGMVQDNEEKIRFTWVVRSLPWLILTDRKHIVTVEGLSVAELDKKLNDKSN